MLMNYLFVDAETDSLYGRFLSIAAIYCDKFGNEINRFYGYIKCDLCEIESEWVRENVFPYLSLGSYGDCCVYLDEDSMIEAFWEFYKSKDSCYMVGDVIHPVESRLLAECVGYDIDNRIFEGPFPFLDVSSMLYAKGIDPNVERKTLVDCSRYRQHNALDDVRMTIDIWKKFVRKYK